LRETSVYDASRPPSSSAAAAGVWFGVFVIVIILLFFLIHLFTSLTSTLEPSLSSSSFSHFPGKVRRKGEDDKGHNAQLFMVVIFMRTRLLVLGLDRRRRVAELGVSRRGKWRKLIL